MYIIAVIATILFGLRIIFDPEIYWHAYGVGTDLTGINWILGPFLISVGIYLFFKGRKVTKEAKRKEKEEWKKKINHICPKCKQSYPSENNSLKKCPKCKEELILLKEFLKRI